MADKTFYRYTDAKGDAHFVESLSEVPKSWKGAVESVTLGDHSAYTTQAVGIAENAYSNMHWPSFLWGLGLAAIVFLAMRIFGLAKKAFVIVASIVAAGGMGLGFTLKDLSKHLPASVSSVLPAGTDLKNLPSPAEARRILDNLPKQAADRDKTLEAIFQSERK